MLDSGISMIEVIRNKVTLLCKREGLEYKPDQNLASFIERFAIAVNASLVTGMYDNALLKCKCFTFNLRR